jgi:hypothetical protein
LSEGSSRPSLLRQAVWKVSERRPGQIGQQALLSTATASILYEAASYASSSLQGGLVLSPSLSPESPPVSGGDVFLPRTYKGRITLPPSIGGDVGDTLFPYVRLGENSSSVSLGGGRHYSPTQQMGDNAKSKKETFIGFETRTGC